MPKPGGKVNAANLNIEGLNAVVGTLAGSAILLGNQLSGEENVAITVDEINAAGASAVANNAVQARRTTNLILTTSFVDVTLDATDVETDDAVIEHDDINTDDIDISVTGTYAIAYEFDIDTAVTSLTSIQIDARVRLNDGGTGINGSLATEFARNTGAGMSGIQPAHMSLKFIANLTAGDFVTLQAQKRDIILTEAWFINNVTLQVTRLL